MKRCTPDEAMMIAAAREVHDGDRVFVGQGLGIVAAVVAKRYYKKDILLLTEAGMVDMDPYRAPFHIADPTCTHGYAYSIDMADVFGSIAVPGFADVCFLGVAQIDKFGNVNSTVIGDYHDPTMRLSGAGGAPELLAYVHRSILTMRGGRFVEKCDYVTSPGYLSGGDARQRAGLPANCGPSVVINTKGLFRFDPDTKEMYLDAVFPFSSVEEVQKDVPWDLKLAPEIKTIAMPDDGEIDFVRDFDPTASMGRRSSYDLFAKAMKGFLAGKPAAEAKPAEKPTEKEEPKMSVIGAYFAALPGNFNAEKAGPLKATFCFKVSGEGGGEWNVAIAEGKCTVTEGAGDGADLTVSMAAGDLADLVAGKLDPMVAFTTGKLQFAGDISLAMKMGPLFLKNA